MAGFLSGPGVGLPIPGSYYPATNAPNGPVLPPSNTFTLSPGNAVVIPRGRYLVHLGGYALVQMLEPVTQSWMPFASSRVSPVEVDSDGVNFRVANMTGCALAAVVTNGGSSYVAGSTTVTPSAGNSQWVPVIGGRIHVTVSITASGSGYTVPPLVFIPPPPAPGVQATAVAVLSSGTVSSITIVNQGAGYQSAPTPVITPNPADPAAASGAITSEATAVLTLIGTGTVSAVLCANSGASFATVPSLTIAGAGSSAAATIVPMWTITGTSITSGGAGYAADNMITTLGGRTSATPAYTNPEVELTGYIPRQAQITVGGVTGGTITTVGSIIDGGLFTGTPTTLLVGGAPSTAATIGFTLGSVNTTVRMQLMGG